MHAPCTVAFLRASHGVIGALCFGVDGVIEWG